MIRHATLATLLLAFTVPAAPAQDARRILEDAGATGGIVVHLGCGDGTLTAALRADDRYLVHGLDTDPAAVEKARTHIRSKGLYGPVTADVFDGAQLPYVDNLVNVIVADRLGKAPMDEVMRVLAPGGVAVIGGAKAVKPRPVTIDEWTHFLHGPDNNAVAKDRVADAPRSLQWVSSPRWGRSHEELASLSAAVTANGRLFSILDRAPLASIRYLGQWELVAQDAFNGMTLWSKPVPRWSDHLRHFRAGPVHLPRRLVAVGDAVYATLGLDAPVTALDAATGAVRRVYAGTERTEEIVVADGVLYLVVGTSEADRTGGGLFARNEPEPTSFRFVTAIEAGTGAPIWKKTFGNAFLLPLTLTVDGPAVFCQSTAGVLRLDARTGKEVWTTPRPTVARRMSFSAPTVVAAGGVLLCADRVPGGKDAPSDGKIAWGVHGWDEPGFPRKAKCELTAYDAGTGKALWSTDCSEGYNSPADVFVLGDTVWVGGDFKRYDLKTGAPKPPLPWKGDRVGMPHHRCYRDKATERFLLTGRSGIEMVDAEKGWVGNNSWIRGTCQYGILPANGLLYAPPNACACFSKTKLQGYVAAAPNRGADFRPPFSDSLPLETGPLYGKAPASETPGPDDWPMYRRDAARSGAVKTALPDSPARAWSVPLGGRLTQPVVAGSRVFVASVDAQTLSALGADDGKALWSHVAGGRIDSAPSVYKGRVYFGSADGRVTCLDARDGGLVWRFRAAPRDRRVGAWGRLESSWPVHGAVLVQNGSVYAAAGRSTYLDGGIVLYRLDPETGKELARTVVSCLDPETGRQTGAEPTGPFNMEGTVSEILSGDGETVFLKHLAFDASLKPVATATPHLLSATGLLGEDWFVRSFWLIGTDVGSGWGQWADVAKSVPAGRILSFDAERAYGYGRVTVASAATGHKADAYHLFCKPRPAASAPEAPPAKGKGAKGKAGAPALAPIWSDDKSLIVRALALASDKLALAGPPDLGQKDPALLAYRNAPEALAAFRGEKGVFLRIVSAADGKTLSEKKLAAMPVFDGLSVAGGRLYVALQDGTVECWK